MRIMHPVFQGQSNFITNRPYQPKFAAQSTLMSRIEIENFTSNSLHGDQLAQLAQLAQFIDDARMTSKYPSDLAYVKQNLRQVSQHPSFTALGLKDAATRQWVGFASLMDVKNPQRFAVPKDISGYPDQTGEIDDVRVAIAFRRQGLATFMMNALAAKARAKGYHSLVLETGNPDAVGLYLKLGFQEIQYQPGFEMSDRRPYILRIAN